jgi:hypothetical protein
MNPLRALFLSLSKMPPAVMLMIIIGLAIIVTMSVTGKVSQQEADYQAKLAADPNSVQTTQMYHHTKSGTAAPAAYGTSLKQAYYTVTYIPANSVLESKQIQQRNVGDLEVWDDAVLQTSDIVGHTVKHAVPANTQLRQSDLQ